MRFEDHFPLINTLLRTGKEGEICLEVHAQVDEKHVRGIALTPTEGLFRGMKMDNTDAPLQAPVGASILSRMFDVFGRPLQRNAGGLPPQL